MKIKNLSIDNSTIHINKFDLDLSEKGTYRLSGSIGSGKTTIIEKILFGSYDVEFATEMETRLFLKEKYRLFSYVPQEIPVLDMTTEKYLIRGNSHVDRSELRNLFKRFDLDESILRQNFSELSGGERIKVSIISALIKDTSYVFLDEPTNHLDDSSVAALETIINELAMSKTILLVSHDERFNPIIVKEYLIEGNDVKVSQGQSDRYWKTENPGDKNNEKRKPEVNKAVRLDYIRVLLSVTRNLPHYISVLFLIITLTSLTAYSNIEFDKNFNTEDACIPGWILVDNDNIYYGDGMTERYVNARGLKIDEASIEASIPLMDVKKIASLPGVDMLYLYDDKYNYELLYAASYASFIGHLEEPLLFSCPEVFFDAFQNTSRLSVVPGFTCVYGRLPQDGKREVALSLATLKAFGGDAFSNAEAAIGKTIDLSAFGASVTHTIVGIIDSDVTVLSYEPESDLGCYLYSEDTFDEFIRNQNAWYNEMTTEEVIVREMLIKVDPKKERNVLEQLITLYPACDYSCRTYDLVWTRSYNSKRYIQVLLPNIIISCLFSIVLVLINRNALKYNYTLLKSYGDYYMDRKKIRRIYRLFTFYQYILVVVLVLIINTAISTFAYVTNSYIILNSAIMVLPLAFTHYKIRKKRKEEA